MSTPHERIYDFCEFRLDATKRLLSRDGKAVALMPKAFDTLSYLVRNGGRIIGKDELMSEVWADSNVEENNLSQNISILRRVLGEKRNDHRFIVTVPGRGFKFVAEVRPALETATPSRMTSIAVLPFRPLVAKSSDEALEMGMTDTLISKLGSEDVVVRPLASVLHFYSDGNDRLTSARELNVDAVLDGTIMQSGERIRVSVRLIRVMDRRQLWSEIYDEQFKNIFKVQEAISDSVASALHVRRRDREKALSTENVEVYQLYIKGRLHGHRFLLVEIRKAISYFEQAIEIDPNYALAYAGLSDARLRLALLNNVPAREALPQAVVAAKRAAELAPLNADVCANLAWIMFWYEWDWSTVEKYCSQAVNLNPNNAFAHMVYAHLLSNTGRHAQALVEIRLSRELDPTSIFHHAVEGQILLFAGQPDEALETLTGAIGTNPHFWLNYLFISRVYNEMQMHYEAISALTKARELFPSNTEALALLAFAQAKAGNPADAKAIKTEMKYLAEQEYVSDYTRAIVHNGLGETDEALSCLEKAFSEKNVLMIFLKVDPKWDNLRNEVRFTNLMNRMNFWPA